MALEDCNDEELDLVKYELVEIDDCADFPTDSDDYAEVIDDNCEDFAAYEELPDQYEIIEIVSEETMECVCCACQCCGCRGFWTQYIVTISGIANTVECAECENLFNDAHVVTWDQGCEWFGPVIDEQCGFTGQVEFGCGVPGGLWTVVLGITGRAVVFETSDDLCECGGSMPVVNTELDFFCDTSGATCTVEPSGEWINCGSPAPDCEEMFMARAAMAPELLAVQDATRKAVREAYAAKQVGPGTELSRLITELGLSAVKGCGCNAVAAKMNKWGVAGCEEHREEILAELRKNKAHLTWLETLKAGVKSLAAGLVLNPLDPAPGLLDEAIRRASQGTGSSDTATGTPDTSK